MAKYKVIMIHGVGKQDPGQWSTPIVAKLKEVASNYQWFKNNPLETRADFIEISYDDLIEAVIKQWSTEANGVAKAVAEQQVTAGKVLEVLGQGGDSEEFYWDNVADVIIYRFFRTFRYAIRGKVAKALKDALQPYFAGEVDTKYMVIAHSMGTMVTHDAIYELMYGTWAGAENALKGKNFKFDSICMLANTGLLLQTELPGNGQSVYDSPIAAGEAAFHYLNCNNKYDPITWARSFKPSWTTPGFEQPVVQHLDVLKPWTVHNMEFYLENPRVHIPILNRIVKNVITANERDKAYADFKAKEPSLESITGEFKNYLDTNFNKIVNEPEVANVIFSLSDFINKNKV